MELRWPQMRMLHCVLLRGVLGAFPEYPHRQIVALNPWQRSLGLDEYCSDTGEKCQSDTPSEQVTVPDVFKGRRVATYSIEVPHLGDSKALVKFTCSLRCEALADGVIFAENDSPYLAMFKELPAGTRELRLVVDGRFHGRHTLHQIQYDWWQPGGIFDEVELHVLRSSAYLSHVSIWPLRFPRVRIEVAASTTAFRFALAFDGREPTLVEADADPAPESGKKPDGGAVTIELDVPEPRLWSLDEPHLHTAVVYLLDGDLLRDAVITRFGLREVAARDGQIFLNGSPVKLLGVNRHHFGRDGSPIVTEEDILTDVAHVKNLGGNFIRGAHYPQDPRLLDACDEEGLLVWEEAVAWQQSVEELTNATFLTMQISQVERMMQASANHPSVIIYGFLNEGMSAHPASVAAYEALSSTIRRYDGSRLVGWASSVTTRDLAWEFADVIGFNDYSGWYPTTRDIDVEELKALPGVWHYLQEWVDEHHPGKPLIASEFGAGGLVGRRGSGLTKWTEECQALLMQLHLHGALQANLAGMALWQLADCPVDASQKPVYRPGGLNNKGLLSTNRTPKVAYGVVRAIFKGHRGLLLAEQDFDKLKAVFEPESEDP